MKLFRADALLALLVLGAYLFTRGFFLTRLEVRVRSTCNDSPNPISSSLVQDGCWLPKSRFRRLVLLVIDGWRFDFASSSPQADVDASSIGEELSEAQLRMIRGHMPKLERLLRYGGSSVERAGRHSAQLYRFVADPPTVTMQRLKGLTSGSLPTFIDAGANFASSAVEEDNLVSQIATAAASARSFDAADDSALIFLGDDTWTGLFPIQFTVARPFPSFDVRDLHTVDDGVLRYLLPALHCGAAGVQAVDNGTLTAGALLSGGPLRCPGSNDGGNASDWRLLVGHFLGVDHVGHRFSTPAHPAMARKLGQMDEAIERVARAIDEDTLLVVMGDHGMTSVGGNHGGASAEEVTAALFLYAKRPGLFLQSQSGQQSAPAPAHDADDRSSGTAAAGDAGEAAAGRSISSGSGNGHGDLTSRQREHVRTVAQTDIVPTLALLLGLPIPYASLGAVLPDVNFGAVGAGFGRDTAAAAASEASLAADDPAAGRTVAAGSAGPASALNDALALAPSAAASTLIDALALASSAAAHHVNAHQLLRYLRTYNGAAGTFAAHEVDALADAVGAGDANLEASLQGLLAAAQKPASACPAPAQASDNRSTAQPDAAAAAQPVSGTRLRRSGRGAARASPTSPGADAPGPAGIMGLLRAVGDATRAATACDDALIASHSLADSIERVVAATQQLTAARELHRSMLLRAAALCRALWTRFDEPSMVAGLAVMAAAILLSLWVVFDAEAWRRREGAAGTAGGAAALPLCSRRARNLALLAFVPPLCVAAAVWPQSIAAGAVSIVHTAVAALRACLAAALPGATPLLSPMLRLLDAVIRSCVSVGAYARSSLPMVWLGAGGGNEYTTAAGSDVAAASTAMPASLVADVPRELWLAAGLVVALLLWPSMLPRSKREGDAASRKTASVRALHAKLETDAAASAIDRKPDAQAGLRNRRATAGTGAPGAAADTDAKPARPRAQTSRSSPLPEEAAKLQSLPLPRSAGSAVFGVAALLLLALRLDGLFTNSFIVAEASVAAHLLCAALLLCWAAACRAALVRLRQQIAGAPASKDAVAAARRRAFAACAAATVMVVVCLLCTRATLQRDGWLWPFPPSDVVASTAASAGDGGADAVPLASSFAEVDVAANLTATAASGASGGAAASATPVPRVETGTGKSSIGWQMELPLQSLQSLQPLPGATDASSAAAGSSLAAAAGGDEDPPATGSGPSLPRWLLLAVHMIAPTVLVVAAAAADGALQAAHAASGASLTSHGIVSFLAATIAQLRSLPIIAVAVTATVAQLMVACFWRGQQVAVPVAADVSSLDAASLAELLWTGRCATVFPVVAAAAAAGQSAPPPSHSLLEASPLLRLALPRTVYVATLGGLIVAAALSVRNWRACSRACAVKASQQGRSSLAAAGIEKFTGSQQGRSSLAAAGIEKSTGSQQGRSSLAAAGVEKSHSSLRRPGDAAEHTRANARPSSQLLPRIRIYVVLLPSLSLLLGPGSPVVLVAMGLHALCLAGLRALASPVAATGIRSAISPQAEASGVVAAESAGTHGSEDAERAEATGRDSCCSRAGAAALALFISPLACHSLALSWSALHYYLATGHGNQFNSLHFAAPFVGFDSYSPLLSSALMALNTLAAHVVFFGIFGGGLMRMTITSQPSPVSVPATASARLPVTQHSQEENGSQSSADTRKQCDHHDDTDARSAPALALQLPNALAFACTAAFCCIARRHLMVWAIFAPKFCFDAMHLAAAGTAAVAVRLGAL